jgi:hypothetical protein
MPRISKVLSFPEAVCPKCGGKLNVIVVDGKEQPSDRIFCVIHGRVGTRGHIPGSSPMGEA